MNNPKTVLIVDDSPSIRVQVQHILGKAGIKVRMAGNKMGMMNSIEEYGIRADLIIMDLSLRNEHGFDLITDLRENEKYRNIPILILTEHADRQNVLAAKELGVDGYLRKPIVPEEMIKKLETLFDAKEKE